MNAATSTPDTSDVRDSRIIRRMRLHQYKSIEFCELDLDPFTILVGRNGAGKSNIVDALRFVQDALRTTLDYAIRERGGIDHVRRKSLGGRPTHPAIELDLQLPDGATASYGFRIAAVKGRGFRVDWETCEIASGERRPRVAFEVADGQVGTWTASSLPPSTAPDRLLLVAASGLPEFRPVYECLTRMAFHNLNPEVMKNPQRPEPGELLAHDGRNLASVVKQLQVAHPDRLARVVDYVRNLGVPVSRIAHKQAGTLETIEIAQETAVPEGTRNSNFEAVAISDGTIRAIGVLVSVLSATGSGDTGPALVGIEEPETALHPAAAAVLMDALIEGSHRTQLLVTCHSPDFLDHPEVSPNCIRPVVLERGRSIAGVLDPRKVRLLQEHLSTPGELLRLDQLTPDPEDLRRRAEARGTLWESAE